MSAGKMSNDWCRGTTEFIQNFANRRSSHWCEGAARHLIYMVWLYRSPTQCEGEGGLSLLKMILPAIAAHRWCTDQKENIIFLIYKEIQRDRVQSHIWLMASSYMVKNVCAFPHILGRHSSYMTLHPIPSEYPYIWGNFIFFFISVGGEESAGMWDESDETEELNFFCTCTTGLRVLYPATAYKRGKSRYGRQSSSILFEPDIGARELFTNIISFLMYGGM